MASKNKNIDRDKTKKMLIDKYIESLKQNELPWIKGWKTLSSHRNGYSNRSYTGKNALLLSLISSIEGYKDARWFTFDQIKRYRHEHDISGEMFSGDAKGKGVPITGYGMYSSELKKMLTFKECRQLIDEGKINAIYCFPAPWKTNFVFNADIINGMEPDPRVDQVREPIDMNDAVSSIISGMNVGYKEEGDRAFYRPSTDTVTVPYSYYFKDPTHYYSTQLHELCHATGHESRLNRPTLTSHSGFGSTEYAKEELRAEIASSFLCAKFDIPMADEHITNHMAYIQNWISVLEDEPEELFKAIDDANKIEQYVSNILEKDIEINPDIDEDMDI